MQYSYTLLILFFCSLLVRTYVYHIASRFFEGELVCTNFSIIASSYFNNYIAYDFSSAENLLIVPLVALPFLSRFQSPAGLTVFIMCN